MIIKWFNSDFLRESTIVKKRLVEIIDNEIKSIKTSISVSPSDREAEKLELHKLLQSLLVKRSLAEFEAEEIVKKRLDLRISFSALIISILAALISMWAVFMKA